MSAADARWQRVNALFHAALTRAPATRDAFLSAECGDDAGLRREVQSLLDAHDDSQTSGSSATVRVGFRIGDYEVTGFIAKGGMGEVYRARDRKLGRDVALKILPAAFVADPGRRARFEREARVLALLNHPHIATIYGFEEEAGVHALALELVEGETLDERIAHGKVPLEDTLQIARQVAEALAAAHEQGIIHRDLKPANIKVTADGTVKVLDFGLAKLANSAGSGQPAAGRADVSLSPTITSPAMMTGIGVILGTAAYMAPEQAKGHEADKRSDIWAFGCVLYQMLTGPRPFDSEDISDTLANVLKSEPDWSALPVEIPSAIRTLLQACLTKDRRHRVADISIALFVLEKSAGLAPSTSLDAATSQARADAAVSELRRVLARSVQRRVAIASAAATLLAGALVATTLTWFATRPVPPSVVRTTVTTSGATVLTLSRLDRDVALTPDGSRVVYRGNNQLLVRALNQLEPAVLSGLGAPHGVFISPDGQWVGFFDGFSLLKKVAITGGPPVTVAAIQGVPGGATWSADGTIIFATTSQPAGLQRVSVAGGEPTVLTKPDRERGESYHLWPEFLPGGNAVLFTIIPANGGRENAQIAVLDLQTGKSKVLIRGGSDAHYVSTGHLVYGVTGTLRAVAFNLERLEVVGTSAPVLEGVATTVLGAADVAVAANGSLVYVPGGASGGGRQTVVSVDRQGRASPLSGIPLDAYFAVRVSPDGARLALATQDDVWIYDFARATLSRLTTHPAPDNYPLWAPDGKRIIFMSRRAGYPELFWRPADSTGSDERLLARAKDLVGLLPTGWSADGRQLLFTEVPPSIQCAIGQITMERPSEVKVLVKNEFCNAYGAVSPDGRWMAYTSGVSGRDEIYIERFPELGNRQQISTGGGTLPLWSRDGRELFFSTPDGRQMFAIPLQSGTTLVAGRPQVLFELAMLTTGGGSRPYDIAPDGRFLIIRSGQADAGGGPSSNMIVVQNWTEELKRLVPTK